MIWSVRAADPKSTRTWLSTTWLAMVTPASGARASAKAPGQGAAAIDQVGHAGPAQLAQGGPGGEAARPSRGFRHEVARRPEGSDPEAIEVGRAVRHRRGVGLGVGAEDVAGVVGNIEPFVAVASPRVGPLDAGDEVACGRAGRRPQAEGAVHVNPRPAAASQIADGGQVVAGAGVDVAGLGADDGRPPPPASRAAAEGVDVDGAVGVRRHLHHRRRPSPRSRSDASMLAWRSSLARTRMRGAPTSPRSSTSQPACSSTRCRAAASPTVLAPCRAGHQSKRGRLRDAEQVL